MIGRKKCEYLKDIRRRFADENSIPYHTKECNFTGECRGTCPYCEAEMRYLNLQASLLSSGKRLLSMDGRPWNDPVPRQADLNGHLFPLISLTRLHFKYNGPGITTLVAAAGCPLSCRWCINRKAMQNNKKEMVTAEELICRLSIDHLYYLATEGGVAFGGGEPMLYTDFIREFCDKRPPEWQVIIETSLSVPGLKFFPDALYMVDCKSMNPAVYRAYTGGDPDVFRNNLQKLAAAVGTEKIRVRIPLIPDYNTKKDQLQSEKLLRNMGFEYIDLFDYVIPPDGI